MNPTQTTNPFRTQRLSAYRIHTLKALRGYETVGREQNVRQSARRFSLTAFLQRAITKAPSESGQGSLRTVSAGIHSARLLRQAQSTFTQPEIGSLRPSQFASRIALSLATVSLRRTTENVTIAPNESTSGVAAQFWEQQALDFSNVRASGLPDIDKRYVHSERRPNTVAEIRMNLFARKLAERGLEHFVAYVDHEGDLTLEAGVIGRSISLVFDPKTTTAIFRTKGSTQRQFEIVRLSPSPIDSELDKLLRLYVKEVPWRKTAKKKEDRAANGDLL